MGFEKLFPRLVPLAVQQGDLSKQSGANLDTL